MLQWQTNNEINTHHFIIEHSVDAGSFTAIGTVNKKGNVSGNYSFEEPLCNMSGVVYYRLKIVDTDGRFMYSTIISIHINTLGDIHVYPIPVKNKVTLQIDNAKLLGTVATVTDVNGKALKNILIKNLKEVVDMSSLPAGIYLLKTTAGSTEIIKN